MTAPAAPPRILAAALWLICLTAMLAAFAAIVGTAESLSFQNITFAQAYTGSYLVAQPAAAAVYLMASGLAAHHSVVPDRQAAALLLAAPSLIAAELFLAGPEGPLLPGGAWILVKGLLVLALLLGLRRLLRPLAPSRLFAIACAAVIAGLVNVAVTAVGALS